MNKSIVGIIVIIVFVTAGFIIFNNTKSESPKPESIQMAAAPTASETTMMKESARYIEYSAANLKKATEEGKAVLFFHATWCPTCKVANEAFTNNSSQIPEGVTVLKTDYDSQKDLKAKYGITYQHTFVQVNSEGNELAKWNGGDIDELVKNIK